MPFVRVLVLAGLSLLCVACGGESGSASAAPESGAESAERVKDCSLFGEELIRKWGKEKQLVLNLSLAKGRNLKTMRETTGAPDPATFRALADAFERFDWSGIEPLKFQTPEEIIETLRKTADLLEAALAAGDNTADPAWAALAEFYTPIVFGRNGSAISYHLSEAGCA